MKLQKLTLAVMLLLLVVDTQCGVISDICESGKSTISGLNQDISNVLDYGTDILGLKTVSPNNLDNRTEEQKRGLIGGIIHSTKDKVHSIRNYFWNTDVHSADAGVFGNMYNRVTNRLSKIKGSILGDNQISVPTQQPESENKKLIRGVLNKLFFGNGTRQVHGNAFQETINNLRKELQKFHDNVTASAAGIPIRTPTSERPVYDGEGMIDVRTALENSTGTLITGVNNKATEFKDKLSDAIVEENQLL